MFLFVASLIIVYARRAYTLVDKGMDVLAGHGVLLGPDQVVVFGELCGEAVGVWNLTLLLVCVSCYVSRAQLVHQL